MLRDRFSAHSTPSASPPPHGRTFSPAPRTSSRLANQGQRPGFSRQSSTFSLASGSNTSLPATARIATNSPLKQSKEPPPDVPDPLKVLRSILGAPSSAAASSGETLNNDDTAKELRFVDDIDFGDLSLEDFASQPLEQPISQSSHINSTETIPQCESDKEERERYKGFHSSITACDDVLQSVETNLSNFQAELGAVSAEIENLQSRSIQLNARLENRRNVEKLLGPAVEEISISPGTVRTISEGPIDEDWVRALCELEIRSNTLEKKGAKEHEVRALEDLKPLLDDLKAKAVERIRDFVVAQIKALRSPGINAQVVQQSAFLKHKELYAFLWRQHPTLASEIGQAYVNTMKWYYTNHFTRYHAALEKLQLYAIDGQDLLGTDPTAQKKAQTSTANRDPYGLGHRADILRTEASSAITSYLAEGSKMLHYIETPFQNFNLAILDNASAEYSVVTEFFSTKSFHEVNRIATEIFDSVFTLGRALTKQLVEQTTDCLGILLCIRLNQHFAFEAQRRKVPVAESYINGTNMILWPRLQQIMDLHSDSLKKVASSTNRTTANAALSLVGGSDASKTSLAPHTITQRFGQFLQGMLDLSSEAGDDEPVTHSLARLVGDYESLMNKLSRNAGDSRKRDRYLFNNYSLILTIISDTKGKLAGEQKSHFEKILKNAKGK
ncbi:MAG: hypothetical protein Q9227_001609 [Pyrenula ochraceoflavens]